jgi:signal transduction histidine kinase
MSGHRDPPTSQIVLEELLRLYNDLATAHRELAKKTSELEALHEAKNQLLGIVAHDLRNPIGIIRTYAGFLLEEAAPALSEGHVESLQIIHQQATFLLRMVGDLLDFSALESGRLQLRCQPQDYAKLVEGVVRRSRVLAEPKQIAITFNATPAPHPVLLDAQRIEQVLNNLIGNAVKFSPAGQPVRVELAFAPSEAVVSICDYGPGIPPQELEHLFQPFQRTSVAAPDGEPSTGLGLVISRKIVEAHAGRIWVESKLEEGSKFYFSLPTGPLESESRTPDSTLHRA